MGQNGMGTSKFLNDLKRILVKSDFVYREFLEKFQELPEMRQL